MFERTPMEMNERLGTAAWAGLLVVAGIYDYLADDTLSEAYRRNFREHPVLVGGATLGLLAHLVRPDSLERFDPLSQGLRMIKNL